MRTGGPISANYTSTPKVVACRLCGNIVDVEVDTETGKVTVLRYTVFQDVGVAAHPCYVESQMQGGTVQGIGWALNEEYRWSELGGVANPTLSAAELTATLHAPW